MPPAVDIITRNLKLADRRRRMWNEKPSFVSTASGTGHCKGIRNYLKVI